MSTPDLRRQRLRCLTMAWLVSVTACCAAGSSVGAFATWPQPTSLLRTRPQRLGGGAFDGSPASGVADHRRAVAEEKPAAPAPPPATSPAAAGPRQRMAAGLFLWLGMLLGLVGLGACVLLLARRRQRK